MITCFRLLSTVMDGLSVDVEDNVVSFVDGSHQDSINGDAS